MSKKDSTEQRQSHDADDRAVPMKPSTFDRADDHVAADTLRTFPLSPDRDHKQGPMLSRTVRQALEILVRSEGVVITRAFCWSVSGGLTRIEALPDTRSIVRVFGLLIDRGASLALLDSWTYSPDREGMRRLSMHNVPPSVSGGCSDLAKALGLSASTLYGLAIRAGLAGVALPGEVSEQLHDDLIEFRAALRKRAKHARRVSASVQASAPVRYDWEA